MVVILQTYIPDFVIEDKIIIELFQSIGDYKHDKTIIRNIPSKRLPKANSPSNVKGAVGNTMNHEFIVVLRKRA